MAKILPRIVLVHGIYSKEGMSNVWNMKAPLEKATGLPVVVFEYGYLHAFQARFDNPAIAKRLAHIIESGDIIVCHSNGAAVTWLATQHEGARPSGVVMINPALDHWRMPVCDWSHIYYNADDSLVWWSKLLPGNIWGDMGEIGYRAQGDNMTRALVDVPIPAFKTRSRVTQINTIDAAYIYGVPKAAGHLAMFQSPCVGPWGAVVGKMILGQVKRGSK